MRRRCAFDGCKVGASRDGFCAEHAPDGPLPRRLPSEPLVALVEARGGPTACGALPKSYAYRGYFEVRRRGTLTPLRADQMSHQLLGCHPSEVWPEWFGPYGVSV